MSRDCGSCEDLRKNASTLVANNDVTDTACTSLMNNTGFDPSTSTKDCDDLHDANDCLVGNMEDEIEAYDVCDWKDYMKKFVPNVWVTLKAMICAICGLWSKVELHDCQINALFGGIDITFNENMFTPGTGISFARTDAKSVDLSCIIKGNLARFHGSILVDLTNSRWGNLGLHNNGTTKSNGRINTVDENYLIATLKFQKSKYPQIKRVYSDTGSFVNAGCAQIRVRGFDENTQYFGQWGTDSAKRTVPAGWYYVTVELANLITWGTVENQNQARVTFDCLNMVDIDQSAVC